MSTTFTDAPLDHDPTPRPTNPREIPIFARSGGSEIWREIVGTERDEDPCGRFSYVAEKLIKEEPFRERLLAVMREIRGRCVEKDGNHYYRFERRAELDPTTFCREVADSLDGHAGAIELVRMTDLVPLHPWMTRRQWSLAFRRFVDAMTGQDDALSPEDRRTPLAWLFGNPPNQAFIDEFAMPARCVLAGHLVHKSLMGDLAELLAIAAGYAAANYQEGFRHAANYLMLAAKVPPMIVAKPNGFDLIHICR